MVKVMDFKITIDDPTLLAGIAFARNLNNIGRVKEEQFATDEDYLAWVATEAATSYARDKAIADKAAAMADAEAGDFAKLDDLRAVLASEAAVAKGGN
jgi:hypothetical protein